MKKVNNILYAGIFVKEDNFDKLFNTVETKEDVRKIEHPHVTLFFRDNVSLKIMQYTLSHNEETDFKITVDGVGSNDKAIALHVSKVIDKDGNEVNSMNKVKHITLYLYGDGKPVDSNSIKDWNPIEPITFEGYSRIIYKRNDKKVISKDTCDSGSNE